MLNRTTIFGTVAYTLVTFPLAVIWHVVFFKEQYQRFGYFEGEPSFELGLLTIVIQGFILSLLFLQVGSSGQHVLKGIKYSLVMGAFFWTSHVLAFVAKQAVDGSLLFILMESIYLLLQFGIYGVLIGLIHKKANYKYQHN